MKHTFLFSQLAALSLCSSAIAATINNVTVRQRWPWSRLVDINFEVAAASEEYVVANVKLFNGNEQLTVPAASFSGALGMLKDGSYTIVWNPCVTAYTNNGTLGNFRAEVTCAESPLYMIIDLTKSSSDADQITYLTRTDLETGNYGAIATNFWGANAAQGVIWTGVTSDTQYATSKLVFRQIPPGTFVMGDVGLTGSAGTGTVTLTQSYYAGVFELTQRQWQYIEGDASSSRFTVEGDRRPVEFHSQNRIRGSGYYFYTTGYAVDTNSVIGHLRTKIGNAVLIDLPTEAEWEYAARAGTSTPYYDGGVSANYKLASGQADQISNAIANAIGRYLCNGGCVSPDNSNIPEHSALWHTNPYGPSNGTALVGSYLPNAWGLYDTAGNILEYCLTDGRTYGIDPVGARSATTNYLCSVKGGCWWWSAQGQRPAFSSYFYQKSSYSNDLGFRLFAFPSRTVK